MTDWQRVGDDYAEEDAILMVVAGEDAPTAIVYEWHTGAVEDPKQTGPSSVDAAVAYAAGRAHQTGQPVVVQVERDEFWRREWGTGEAERSDDEADGDE